jgi:D-3-phosphoglycerate dehydrogenase
LVNAARGGVISEDAIVTALKSGHIAGVAIDTFENEPKPRADLLSHDNVWCTQHIGASTLEAQIAIGDTIYDQVCKALDGGVVDYPVNLPDIGVPDNNLLKSYSILAQKLGSMVGQVLDFNPTVMEVHYRGDLAGSDTSLVRLGLMKGYAAHVVDDYVSFVNTAAHFEKLGIKLEETEDPSFTSYKSALKVIVKGAQNEMLSIGGIVFDDRVIRISLINEFYFEIDPVGNLLIVENHDRPGVIGDVGHFLARQEINIDNFNLSRNRPGGKAMAIIRTDSDLRVDQLQTLRKIKNVVSAKAIYL